MMRDLFQANVATVMNEERKEGKLARTAMMDKEQKEVRLETDENGLQASAENSDPQDKNKHPHQSIKALKAQIAAAGARADVAKAARKKLQTKLDKDLNQLAHQQFVAHKSGAAPKAAAAKAAAAKAAASKGGKKGVAGMASTMAQTVSRQESVLAGMDMQLLALPKVRKALQQSLKANELKIANEVAKSLGASFNATGIPEAMIAEVTV